MCAPAAYLSASSLVVRSLPRTQRFWERLVNFLMGQLVVLGAVVEPDLAEMMLWGSFTALVCLLGMYAGLARDRIEYMAHTPTPPSRAAWVRVVGLEVCLILVVLGAVVGGVALMHEASASMLTLFFFPAALLGAETSHALVLAFLQQRERHEGSSDLMYYASLLPELSLQLCRLLHQLHLWYAHGVSFSVIDVLLFANAKLAYQEYQTLIASDRWQRLATHGATVQRLLWASTGTKNPDYSNVMYVDELIGPDTVNTLPPNTLAACADHCDPQNRLESGVPEAQTLIDSLADPDIDIQIDQVMAELLDEGIDKFVEPFQSLIQSLQAKIDDLAPVA